ncbi:TolC family protein [Clostridium sp. MB40-C1]|uniref:TolC family protein n=1 Tax=Clostridium sp. MB40-C1 TaxID=3070996 RepID=UPI0027DF1BC8|nr:TolC family protein [Clostridium sp. MB40-C1]WMJ80770.1 TolC family protein [Clostridium sp. MB40-C1]
MNKKVKLLTVAITLVSVLSVAAISALGAADKGSELNLNDIIELTTSNNNELNFFKKKIQVKEKWYDEATKKDDKDSNFDEDMKEEIIPLRIEQEIKDIEWERDQAQDKAIVESTKGYYEIMLQDQLIQLQQKTIERMKKLLEYKKAKIDAGTESAVSLIDDEANLKDAEVKLQQLKNDEEKIRMELNMKIGTPVDKKLNLKKAEIPYKIYEVKNLESVVETMLKKYYTITSLITKEDIDSREKAIVHTYVKDDKNELENAINPKGDYKERENQLEDDIVETKYKLDDEKKNIEAKIRMDYNNIINLNNDIKVKKLDCEKAETMLKTEKTKFEAGTGTELEVKAAEEKVLSASCEYNKAKLDYYVAVEQFKNFTKKALK